MVVRLLALRTGGFYPQEIHLILICVLSLLVCIFSCYVRFILRDLQLSDLTSDMWPLYYFGHKELWFFLTKFYVLVQKHDKQCTYDVILRRVRANIVAVEKQYYICLVCVCSLKYPAWNALLPYCLLWPLRLYNIFPLYLKKWHNFRKKKLWRIKYVFFF
jgi:hypothetical protein